MNTFEEISELRKAVAKKHENCEQMPTDYDIKWVDDDSAFAIFSEKTRELVDMVCAETEADARLYILITSI